MRVLYFHQHFSTPYGSAGTRSYENAKALIEAGHQVLMVCGSYGGGETGLAEPFLNGKRRGYVEGIEVLEFDLSYSNADGFLKRTKTFFFFSLKSIYLVFREKYDVVFATTTPLTAGIPGIFARWLRRKPFVFEVRDLWPELPKAMGVIKNPIILFLMSLLEWVSYHSADRLIGLAPGIVNGISKRGISPNIIDLIPNGCDLSLFVRPEIRWRPEGISDQDIMAIYAGTHGIANGLQSILDAAEELQNIGRSDIKIVLVGEGKCKASLMEEAKVRDLRNVFFLPPIPKDKLPILFASADLGLQILADIPAFYYGTSPNKFFDYIASSLPVLCNYPGWIADMIASSQSGFPVAANDPKAFANALIEAADDRFALRDKGECARLLAESQFNRTQLARNFVRIIEQVETEKMGKKK